MKRQSMRWGTALALCLAISTSTAAPARMQTQGARNGTELARVRAELAKAQAKLKETQGVVEQLRAQLAQAQTDAAQAKADRDRLQTELDQTRTARASALKEAQLRAQRLIWDVTPTVRALTAQLAIKRAGFNFPSEEDIRKSVQACEELKSRIKSELEGDFAPGCADPATREELKAALARLETPE